MPRNPVQSLADIRHELANVSRLHDRAEAAGQHLLAADYALDISMYQDHEKALLDQMAMTEAG